MIGELVSSMNNYHSYLFYKNGLITKDEKEKYKEIIDIFLLIALIEDLNQ